MGRIRRMTDAAFYGSRAKLAQRVEGPLERATPLRRDTIRSLFGALFLFWSGRRVVRALRAGLRR